MQIKGYCNKILSVQYFYFCPKYKSMIRYIAVALILFFLAGTSCRSPKPLEYRDTKNFKVNGLGLNNTNVSMELELYNPNKYGLRVKNSDVDVYVNNIFAGKVFVVDGKYKIPAESIFLLPVKLDADLKNIMPNALKIWQERSLQLKVSGKIKAGKGGLYVSIPVSYEGRQPIDL